MREKEASNFFVRAFHDRRALAPPEGRAGYALPSVLFVLLLVSSLALSLVGLALFKKQLFIADMQRLKAELASQSAIVSALGGSRSFANTSHVAATDEYQETYPDGSESAFKTHRWGLYGLIESIGRSGRFVAENRCLVGSSPSRALEPGVVLLNTSHQLVLTGESFVRGDVVTGPHGVSTGSLPGHATPSRVNVDGKIRRLGIADRPMINEAILSEIHSSFDIDLRFSGPDEPAAPSEEKDFSSVHHVELSSISDSVTSMRIEGEVRLTGSITRRALPLTLTVGGSVELSDGCSIMGLVEILARRGIRIRPDADADGAIFYSQESISVESGCTISAQLISRAISIDSRARLLYPSVLLSPDATTQGNRSGIFIGRYASVQGTVISTGAPVGGEPKSSIVIEEHASVTGLVYCSGLLMLDGTVHGSVITWDFFFHEPPTSYFGWIRSGMVVRDALPGSFLLPVVFENEHEYDILAWL